MRKRMMWAGLGWDGFFSWTVTLSKTHGDRQTVQKVIVT
jgi:hypothetical protein